MPNSVCSAAVIARRRALCHVGDQQHIRAVRVELEPVGDVLAQHRGREGPEASRYFTLRLSVFCMVGERGSPRIERAPSARGPNSMRPWNQPTALPVGQRVRAVSRSARRRQHVEIARRPRCSRASMSACAIGGPEIGAVHARRVRRAACARLSPNDDDRPASAAPSAPPASPAAGWIQMRSKLPSRRILPLATQLSATPPARQRFSAPVSARERARQPQHDLLGHRLDRGGEIHVPLREQLLRAGAAARRTVRRSADWSWCRPVQ